MTLQDIIDALKNAHRFGESKDEPEGVRYIQISDTLAKNIIEKLQDLLDEAREERGGKSYT